MRYEQGSTALVSIYLFILTAVSLLPHRTWSFVGEICARADGPTSSTVYVLSHTLYANTLHSRRFIINGGMWPAAPVE